MTPELFSTEFIRVQFVFILEQVLNGLLVGAYYLLIALGLSLIFALGGIVNLAHGGFYAIGAYLAVILANRIGFVGAFVASPVVVGCFGILIERLLFCRFYRSDPILSLLLTFGLAMVIEQGLRIAFGASPLPFSIPPELRGQVFVGNFIYPRYRLIILGVAVGAVIATWFIVYRTAFGRVVRAGVQNPDVVGALGISLAPYMTAIAALGVGLAGLAGALLAPISGVTRDGRRDPHRRFRRGCDRRLRFVLGRHRGRHARGRRAWGHDLLQSVLG